MVRPFPLPHLCLLIFRDARNIVSANKKLNILSASPRPPHSRARPPHARRAQEWRNTERSLGHLRYMDESYVEGGCANKSCTSSLSGVSFPHKASLQTTRRMREANARVPRMAKSSSDYRRFMSRAITYVAFFCGSSLKGTKG